MFLRKYYEKKKQKLTSRWTFSIYNEVIQKIQEIRENYVK